MGRRDRIRILDRAVLSQHWGVLRNTTFEMQRRDGRWQRLERETYDRGSVAAVLLHCPATDKVILVRQFRLTAYEQGRDGWLLEVCAGMLDGEAPEACARREALEEAGIRIKEIRHAFDADMSPGGMVETASCFIGTYDAQSRVATGGGLEAEGEDLEVIELPFSDALAMIADGRITDAQTIMLLQHLALGRNHAD